METSDKIFIELKNYPFYFACSDGNIYSKQGMGKKVASYSNPYRKLISGISDSGKGYYQAIIKVGEGNYSNKLVHRLVAEAFIGKIPEDMTVSHKDGKKFNNIPSNLLIESWSDNQQRKYEHGTMDNGFNNSRSLITEEQLLEIRELLLSGNHTHQAIGDIYNVGRVFITKIKNGHRYKNC